MKTRVSKGQITAECARLRALSPGSATEEQVDQRMEIIRQIAGERAKGLEHLRKIVDHCLRTLSFFPVPAEVDAAADFVNRAAIKEWKSPQRPTRTVQDVIDDIEFQKRFAIDKPRWADAAREKIEELTRELEAIGTGTTTSR